MAKTWSTGLEKKVGRMAQGEIKIGEKGTNSISFLSRNESHCIPTDRVVSYAHIVVDFRPQKEGQN